MTPSLPPTPPKGRTSHRHPISCLRPLLPGLALTPRSNEARVTWTVSPLYMTKGQGTFKRTVNGITLSPDAKPTYDELGDNIDVPSQSTSLRWKGGCEHTKVSSRGPDHSQNDRLPTILCFSTRASTMPTC